jgi:hypothetical protein
MKPNDKAIEAAQAAILKAMAERNCIIAGVPFNENNYDEFDASEAAEHAKVALDAAYAAQFQSGDYAGLIERLRLRAGIFKDTTDDRATADAIEMLLAKLNNKPKPSEDYAGLIKLLLNTTEHMACSASVEQALWNKHSNACLDAAAAIEALLAERDDFADQLALRSESGMAKDVQEIMRINNELVAERDELAAHLAPVDDDILREIAAMHFARIDGHSDNWDRYVDEAKDYIDAIRPHIEAVERERCAKIAETPDLWVTDKPSRGCDDIAAAIRRGK